MAGVCMQALALGMGEPTVTSVLGQPLQMSVPLMLEPGGELAQECVRIVSGAEQGAPIPSLSVGRATVDAGQHLIRIESMQPVLEPALRVVVELGCNDRIRREFALLLDPPSVAPVAAAGGVEPMHIEPPLGLGMAQISAVLGQPLSLRVPVAGSGAGSLTADCVRLADPISSEGAPVLRQAQIRVLPQQSGSLIEVATTDPVTEPAVRLALDVGCRDPLRREYAILLGLPTLAASGAVADAPEAAAPQPVAPAPKPRARPHKPAAVIATAPESGPKNAAAAAAAPAASRPRPAVAGSSDRLVLASPDDNVLPAAATVNAISAAPDANAELLKRLDTMSKQIETLQAELAASRQRELALQRQAAEAREQWTWSMGALGGLLLGGALVMAWRQRRPLGQGAATWEPVAGAHAQAPIARPVPYHPTTASTRREAPGIGGRATMPPAPITTPAPASEPALADDEHAQITVTELHDTVQVIKELYATVLERTTSNAATTGRPSRPLELDLGTPVAALGAAASPPAKARPVEVPKSRELEERFTELPTEIGLDLDLSTAVAMAAASNPPADFHLGPDPIRGADSRRPAAEAPVELAAATKAEAAPLAQPAVREPAGADGARLAPELAPVKAAGAGFPDEHLTQTPTEVQIDIDVGPRTGFSNSVGLGALVGMPRWPDAEPPKQAQTLLEPIDLQLDLSKPEARIRRRSA